MWASTPACSISLILLSIPCALSTANEADFFHRIEQSLPRCELPVSGIPNPIHNTVEFNFTLASTSTSGDGKAEKNAQPSYLSYQKALTQVGASNPLERIRVHIRSYEDALSVDPIYHPRKAAYEGQMLASELVISNELGHLRESSCLEWALFHSAYVINPDLPAPLPFEHQWYVLSHGEEVKVLVARGKTHEVNTWNLEVQASAYLAIGWRLELDLHNHPALQNHPDESYRYHYDAGPVLVPSPNDLQAWKRNFAERAISRAAITDGLHTLEISQEDLDNPKRFEAISTP